MTIQSEIEEIEEIIEEFDEEDLLMEEKRNNEKKPQKENTISKNNLNTPISTPTPTPNNDNLTLIDHNISDSIDEESNINKIEQNAVFNKESEEEKIYKKRINEYKSLFNEGRINELEELIDICNKQSSSIEYKFNFTFDNCKYGNKQISYIVRCIDNKNDVGESEEESFGDFDPKTVKYKKEKEESIKPLFELFEKERKEIIELPEKFLKLSLENKKFQDLLQECKNDIKILSKAHGQNKLEIFQDENSSQTSQAGFDSGLVKKNKIEEIRSNLMKDISSFYSLKYIKAIIYIITIFSIIFSILYILFYISWYEILFKSSNLNIYLHESALWTSELISIFVNLRVLYLKEIINKYDRPQFGYLDFISEGINIPQYYLFCILKSYELYNQLIDSFSFLEMDISSYLSDKELDNLYWNRVNVSYWNVKYTNFTNGNEDSDSFPMSISQLLSNSFSYFSTFYNITSNLSFFYNFENNKMYFDYMTYIIIENGYNNILPNLFNKLMIIPDIIKSFNFSKIKKIDIIMTIFVVFVIILCLIYIILIHLTNKTITDGMDKVSKIKLEKIEEVIQKINIFNLNLKNFEEKELKNENKSNKDIVNEENQIKSEINNNINNDKNKKKGHESSLINNNGFYIDYKRYIPLSILRFSFHYPVIILLLVLISMIPIYLLSLKMVNYTNKLLVIQNYFFGKLIITSTSTIEIKCFISECKDLKEFNYTQLINKEKKQEVLKGLTYFNKVSYFYNEKFSLNACAAAINNETNPIEYNICLSDTKILAINSTENLMKLISDLIFILKKEFEINNNKTNNSYYRRHLFNEPNYRDIEKLFFNYFMSVEENFVKCNEEDILIFLSNIKSLVILIVSVYAILMVIYCLIARIFIINKIVHYLTVSRIVMKIIPTSIIISTPELESWIENRY